jgi:hypothetical protein
MANARLIYFAWLPPNSLLNAAISIKRTPFEYDSFLRQIAESIQAAGHKYGDSWLTDVASGWKRGRDTVLLFKAIGIVFAPRI